MAAHTNSARWIVWLVVIVALALGLGPAMADVVLNGAQVSVQPAHQELLVGASSAVDLAVVGAPGLYAAQLSMTYDPSVIEIQDADPVAPGVQIGAGDIFAGRSWHEEQNLVDPAAGTISYIVTLDDDLGGVDRDGALARIDFVAIQPGSSPVAFTELLLADPTGTSINHQRADGEVRVVLLRSTATHTPSATPTEDPCADPCPPRDGCCPEEPEPEPSCEPPKNGWCEAEVYIDPEAQWFFPNTEGWVDIRISNVSDLYAAWVKLRYNPAVVEIIDSDATLPGTQVEHGDIFAGKAWYPVANEVNPGTEMITYGAKLSFTEQTSSGGGQLARIRFRTLAPGVSPFEFVEVILADQEGVSIPTADDCVRGGVVEVGTLRPTATPTATPTPRESPTPTPCCCVSPTPCCCDPAPTPTATPPSQERPLLFVYPDALSMVVGEEADVEIRVQDVASLYGVEFHLSYDPALLAIQDEDAGKAGIQIAYGGFVTPASVAQNNVDEAVGRVNFAIAQAPPSPPRNGSGIIAKMRIVALADGATSLSLFDTQMADQANNPIAHGIAGGFVAISSRTVVGSVEVQGRYEHQGVQILLADGQLSATQLLATSGQDGRFVFAAPVAPGEQLAFVAQMDGYLPRRAELTLPVDPVVDVGAVMLLGGDSVGPQITAPLGVGCPGGATMQVPGGPDWVVSILDLTFVGSYFNAVSDDLDWEPPLDGCHPGYLGYRADFNQDLIVNIFDLVQVGNNFGAAGPMDW